MKRLRRYRHFFKKLMVQPSLRKTAKGESHG